MFGKHMFIMVRPVKRDWSDYDGSTMRQGREEFRPCMIRGHNSSQSVRCHGSAYAYPLEEFEELVVEPDRTGAVETSFPITDSE